MAQTELHNYSVQEKLNKMDVDLIDVTLTTAIGTINDDYVVSSAIEIPNAVAVNGGTAIIQSILLYNDDNSVESPGLELIFAQQDTDIGTIDAAITMEDVDAIGNILGSTTVTNWSIMKAGDHEFAVKSNIGLVVKAASGTTSIYAHVINRSGGNYTPSSTTALTARIGIVKD